jgi:hypothetical protein
MLNIFIAMRISNLRHSVLLPPSNEDPLQTVEKHEKEKKETSSDVGKPTGYFQSRN